MTISELISQLESIREKQGDCEVWVDVPERNEHAADFQIADRWYVNNLPRNNCCFIVLGLA